MDRSRIAMAAATAAARLVVSTQIASAQSGPLIGNLGLRIPTEKNAIRPDFAPPYVTQMPLQVPGLAGPGPAVQGLAPGVPGISPGLVPIRSLADPTVAANSIGFYNGAGQTLSFQFVAGGTSQKIELTPRQILTIQVDAAGSDLKAIIGTGSTDFQTTLSRGTIYVLRADGGKWVLGAL